MTSPILKLHQVNKTFDGHNALSNMELELAPGDIYALFGPNGAGKTTTINLILGFLKPDSGTISVEGFSPYQQPQHARRHTAYLPESVALHPQLNGIENLKYFSLLAGIKLTKEKCEDLLNQAGLNASAHTRAAREYSKGMRQKVAIAIALAKDAKLLLLDEPTSGLDPSAANDFFRTLSTIAKQGMAILMTTHDFWRIQETATRIGILQGGSLQEINDPRNVDIHKLEAIYAESVVAS